MAGVQKDQGWAWVVLAASATSLFIFVVLASSAGFFQVEIMEDLEVGSGPISIMSSLALGQSCMLGPLSGLLASLLSVRVTVFLGVIFYSGGLLLASFSQSVASVTFSLGFLTGFGFGIAYTATIVVISLHFERHRLLASGIAMCAPGLGTLSLPHAITWGIEEHGWRWTATMMAGFVLHIAVMASVYFPTDTEKQTMVDWSAWWSKLAQHSRDIYVQWNGGHWKDKVVKAETSEACSQGGCKRLISLEHKTEANELNGTGRSVKISDDVENEISSKHKNEEMQMLNISNVDNGGSQSTRKGNEDTEIKSEDLPQSTLKAGGNDTKNIQQNITIVDESDAEAAKIRENLAMNFEEFISREDLRSFKITNRDHILRLGGGSIHEGSLKSLPLTSSTHKDIFECFSSSRLSSPSKQPLNLKDFTKIIQSENIINDYLRIPGVILNTSVENIEKEESVHQLFRRRSSTSVSDHSYPVLKKDSQLHQSQTSHMSRKRTASWMYSQTDVMGSSLLLPVRVEEVQAETAESDGDTSVKEKIKIVIRCKSIWMLGFTSFCFIFGYGLNTVHFASFAERQGVPLEKISNFYTAFGLVMMVSRLSGGAALNRFRSKAPLATILCILQTFMGVFLALSPYYATTLEGLYIMQVGLAFTYGIGYMLFAPICADICGVELLAISFGLVQLFIGSGFIISPIIAGFLYDATGTLDVPLVLGGFMITIGVLPLALTICLNSCRRSSIVVAKDDVEAAKNMEAEAETMCMLEQKEVPQTPKRSESNIEI